jgi:zona occludens toxin
MAITAYVGLPGHGKSYGVVENVIIPALEKKRVIFTNIPMKSEVVFEKYGINVIQFETDDIKKNPDWWSTVFQAGALFVLDEVPKLWPAGLKANAMHENDRSFLAEHRHMVGDEGLSTEIILVVQNLTMIAAFPRGLIETTFWVVKHVKMGSTKRFRLDVYSGVMSGQSPQLSKREREIQGKFKPEVYALYHSHTKSKTGIAGDETKSDNRNNMFKGASIKIGIISIIVLGILAYLGLSQVAEMYSPQKSEDELTELTETSETTQPLKKLEIIKPKKKGLLNNIDEINFAYSLKERTNGVIKRTSYFKLMKGSTESLISEFDLVLLGYKIKEISECLYHFTNDNFDEFIMCNKVTPDKGFFNNLVQGESD